MKKVFLILLITFGVSIFSYGNNKKVDCDKVANDAKEKMCDITDGNEEAGAAVFEATKAECEK